MRMLCKQVLFLAGCLVVSGDYFIPKPKGSDVEIPESLEKLEKTFPQGSDWMKLLRAERTIAKNGALKLIFRDLPENADEVIVEKSIFVYCPHRENAPTTNYTVHIRDLFTGQLIAHKLLPIQNTGWHKILLNRWPEDRGLGLISAHHGLEIRIRQKGGKEYDFEEFYKNGNFNHKFLPSLLIYYENKKPRSLKDFFNISEFENLDKLHSNMPANLRRTSTEMDELPSGLPASPRRLKRDAVNTSCNYTTQDMYAYLNLTAINPYYYHPNTTAICTGSCTPALNTSSTCDQNVQDCCVASKKRAFIILFWEVSSFVLRSFPDMVVEECACASSVGTRGTGNNG